MSEHISVASYLCALPAGLMLLGGIIALFTKPPKTVTAMFQHFAAGIIICAVAVELLPIITRRNNGGAIAGMIIGFVVGVALMILLRMFCGEKENTGGEK